MDIITEVEGVKPSIFDDDKTNQLLEDFFLENIQNTDYLKIVNDYFIEYYKTL